MSPRQKQNVEWIKRHYIKPPIRHVDTYFHNKEEKRRTGIAGCSYEVQMTIWLTDLLPSYRVAIPSSDCFDGNGQYRKELPIQTVHITYVPTGKIVYDNSGPEPVGIVYEYLLEHLVGRRELAETNARR